MSASSFTKTPGFGESSVTIPCSFGSARRIAAAAKDAYEGWDDHSGCCSTPSGACTFAMNTGGSLGLSIKSRTVLPGLRFMRNTVDAGFPSRQWETASNTSLLGASSYLKNVSRTSWPILGATIWATSCLRWRLVSFGAAWKFPVRVTNSSASGFKTEQSLRFSHALAAFAANSARVLAASSCLSFFRVSRMGSATAVRVQNAPARASGRLCHPRSM